MSNATQTGAVQDGTRDFHLKSLFEIVYQGRFLTLGVAALVVAVTCTYVFLKTPLYKATATVHVSTNTVQPMAHVNPFSSFGYYEGEKYFNAELEVLNSMGLAQAFVQRPEIANDPEVKGADNPAGYVRGRILISPEQGSSTVRVSVVHPNAAKAAKWANIFVETYKDENLRNAVDFLNNAHHEIQKQIADFQSQYLDKNSALLDKDIQAGGYVSEEQKKILDSRISQLEQELTQVRIKRQERESFVETVKNLRARGGSLQSLPVVSGDEVVSKLKVQVVQLEGEYQKLVAQFTPEYPAVIKKKKELDSARGRLGSEINNLVGTATNELASLREQESKLQDEIGNTQKEALGFKEKEAALGAEKLATESLQSFMQILTEKANQINLSAAFLKNNIRVIEYATPPASPYMPRPKLSILLALFLGGLLGVGVTFFIDYMDNTVKTAEDVERKLRLNLLTMVPRYKEGTAKAVKEAFHTLRTSLIFASKGRALKLVLFTSAGPGEGKSSTIANLAKILANSGDRVLLIDCDLRKPTIQRQFGVSSSNGLTKYLAARNEAKWRDFILNTSHPNLWVMLAGPIPPNPPELFGLNRFKQLLEDARAEYDWVLIDSPPLLSITDSTILASMVDMVSLVVRHGKTDIDLIQRAVLAVKGLDAHMVGAVLNDVDPEKSYYQEYYFMSNYYYGSEMPSKKGLGKVAEKIKGSFGASR